MPVVSPTLDVLIDGESNYAAVIGTFDVIDTPVTNPIVWLDYSDDAFEVLLCTDDDAEHAWTTEGLVSIEGIDAFAIAEYLNEIYNTDKFSDSPNNEGVTEMPDVVFTITCG